MYNALSTESSSYSDPSKRKSKNLKQKQSHHHHSDTTINGNGNGDKNDFAIDELDREIINILIANGRDSARTIVNKLKEKGIRISERGVGKRIERLEKHNIIHGYTALVDLKKVNMLVPRLVTVKFTSPKDFVERLQDMKGYLKDAPFCDLSARTNGSIDWIEIKFFNNMEQAQREEDLYRSWFGDIIEDYRSYDLDLHKFGWQIFDEEGFERFISELSKSQQQ